MTILKDKFQKYLTVLTCVLIILSGCKNNPLTPVSGSSAVSGTVMLNNSYTNTNTPLPGIKVYLVNINFKVDTVNFANNQAAFVDSAVSDSNGKYTMSNIKAGNYAVVPSGQSGEYQFSLAAGSGSDTLNINSLPKTYSVNFTAPFLATVAGMFTINLHSVNIPVQSNVAASTYMNPFREQFAVFVPTYTFQMESDYTNSTLNFPYGWTCLFYTLTNNFEFDCRAYEGTTVVASFSIYINLPLTGCPASSDWQIDWKEQTVKRLD